MAYSQINVKIKDVKEFIEKLDSKRMLDFFEQMIGKSEDGEIFVESAQRLRVRGYEEYAEIYDALEKRWWEGT